MQTALSRTSVDIPLPDDTEAIEFLFKDEVTNKWYSLPENGNFRVEVPPSSRRRAAPAASASAAASAQAPSRQPPKSRLHALADQSVPFEAQNYEARLPWLASPLFRSPFLPPPHQARAKNITQTSPAS